MPPVIQCDHDDIGWGLDYEWLKQNFGTDEVLHKRYLNDYFQGYTGNSNSRGELYNDDIASGDDGLLAISRYAKGQKIIGVFNIPLRSGGVYGYAHGGSLPAAGAVCPGLRFLLSGTMERRKNG